MFLLYFVLYYMNILLNKYIKPRELVEKKVFNYRRI